jgi:hypothetical protein
MTREEHRPIEALQKFHYYYQEGLKVECAAGSGQMKTLWDVAAEPSHRLTHLFLRDAEGRRPAGQPPDRLDGAGGKANPAERGMNLARSVGSPSGLAGRARF